MQVEATPKDKMADKTGPPSTIGHPQLPGVDQLVKACVSYLIDRVEETKEGGMKKDISKIRENGNENSLNNGNDFKKCPKINVY